MFIITSQVKSKAETILKLVQPPTDKILKTFHALNLKFEFKAKKSFRILFFKIFNIIHNFDNCQNKDQTRKNVGLTYFKNKNKEIMLLWSK